MKHINEPRGSPRANECMQTAPESLTVKADFVNV